MFTFQPSNKFLLGNFAALLAICVVCSTSPARGESKPYSAADVQDLVRAVLRIPIDHQFTLGLILTPSNEMPTWDPIAHYTGTEQLASGKTAFIVDVSDRYRTALADLAAAPHTESAAVLSAVFLATIDAGRAGERWKTLYDGAARADAALGADAPNPYLNRHELVAQLANSETALYGQIAPKDTPSADEFGLPLSEPIAYGTGMLEYARLGVGMQRLLELFEYPGALQENSTKKFIERWFAHLGALLSTGTQRAQLMALRGLFNVTTPTEQMTHQQRFAAGMQPLIQSFTRKQIEVFGIGYDAAEIRYNALAIMNAREDTLLRKLLASSPSLDDSFATMKELRLRLASVPSGDWAQITEAASKVVILLVPST